MQATTIAIDLAKEVFQVAIQTQASRQRIHKRLSRKSFSAFVLNQPPAHVVMEACATSHYWARRFGQAGHQVTLLPAQHVRGYRRRNKTDKADALALLEAVRNPELVPVSVKTADQQAVLALHRVRAGWMQTRTARINAMRGLLREFGVDLPRGAISGLKAVGVALDDDTIPPAVQSAIQDMLVEVHQLEDRVAGLEKQLERLAAEDAAMKRIRQVPGIGLLSATALAAAAGSAEHFRSGRHMAAWLGLTPREYSSGKTRYLGRISKRGDPYLRLLLIHGARAAILQAKRIAKADPDQLSRKQRWVLELEARSHHNKAAVALANKMVRSAWDLWKYDRNFDGNHALNR